MEDRNERARYTCCKSRLRFGEADYGHELGRGLMQLKSIHLAAAQRQLTPAQYAAFVAFIREVTLPALGCTDWPEPAVKARQM